MVSREPEGRQRMPFRESAIADKEHVRSGWSSAICPFFRQYQDAVDPNSVSSGQEIAVEH
jgi:hypothetical protein